MTNWISHTIEPWMPKGALKAKDDYAKIAESVGFRSLSIERYNDQRFGDTVRTNRIQSWLKDVVPGDLIVHQFPTYMSASFEQEWLQAIHDKKAHYVLLIHDFEPFRVQKSQPNEFALAQEADLIIAHSQAMVVALKKAGIQQPTLVQPLFDYLGPTPLVAHPDLIINYAGTWQKAPWLQNYRGPKINLFGNKPKKWQNWQPSPDINWAGNFDPDEIAHQLSAGLGLLWDSDFDDRFYQSYTKINAPHKASLYLKAGLPLIAWDQSHLGQVIEEQQIGLTITDLAELKVKLSTITTDQYQSWQRNLVPIQAKINTGGFTKNTLASVRQFFKNT